MMERCSINRWIMQRSPPAPSGAHSKLGLLGRDSMKACLNNNTRKIDSYLVMQTSCMLSGILTRLPEVFVSINQFVWHQSQIQVQAAMVARPHAWNIHNETFMKDIDWIKMLKLRMAYGFSSNVAARCRCHR